MSVDARTERQREDADGEFVRATKCVAITATGHVHVVTAATTDLKSIPLIPDKKTTEKSLVKALKAFQALPEEDRKPSKLDIGAKAVDVKRSPPAAPTDVLFVRLFNRQLGRGDKGELRYTLPEDYEPTIRKSAARYGEPGNDFMWVPANEWKALVPAEPKKGIEIAAPAAFALRLYRYHLDPARGLAENQNFRTTPLDAGKLTVTVTDIADGKIQLRLTGLVNLLQKRGSDERKWLRYEPALLGHLTYDTARKAFTRFDIVALGHVTGAPTGENLQGYRPGSHPLGVAFELVDTPTKSERLAPRAARDDLVRYLSPQDK